jgi:hypothetical protein
LGIQPGNWRYTRELEQNCTNIVKSGGYCSKMAALTPTITLSVRCILQRNFVQFFIPCGLLIFLFIYLFIYLFTYCTVSGSEYRAWNICGLGSYERAS